MNNLLLNKVQTFLSQCPPDPSKDQFFLVDVSIIKKMIEAANVNLEDSVLEVGSGLGFLTEALAIKAKKVITIEIDERLRLFLSQLPNNVKIIFGDAYKLLNNQVFRNEIMPITKSVSSIPYRQAQNMLHNYASDKWYKGDLVWLAPASLANKVNKEHILSSWFNATVIQTVPKTAFFPQPNTTSAIVYFKRVPNPIDSGDFTIYFRRWLYKHERAKVKNAIRDGIIHVARDLKQKVVTKNQARELVSLLTIPQEELDKLTNNIRPDYYFEIPNKLNKWFKSL